MLVDMPSPTQLTQTVAILTDVQVAHPAIVCPITATLTPSANYISLSANADLITITAAQIATPTDYGNHTFTLTV